MLRLSNITLLGIDCIDAGRLIRAAEICQREITFGDVMLLTSLKTEYPAAVTIEPVTSKEAYSHFIMKRLADFFTTDFVLIIQYDGFILNPKAWTNEFLTYDYIGAPWWYRDGMNVGNGGFSLRSKRLHKILQRSAEIREVFPEDHHTCRTYRPLLEKQGIRFAPEALARRFSIEGKPQVLQPGARNTWMNEFGFHGLQKTDISAWFRLHPEDAVDNTLDPEYRP